jgi:lauroyl/myristoyl acyltransferase
MTRTDTGLTVRWHAGTFNNGLIFGATYHSVSRLPREWSYRIGHVCMWLAHQLMRGGTRAVVENLRVVRPEASERELRRLALLMYRSYACDTIDFIRGLSMDRARFEPRWRSSTAIGLTNCSAKAAVSSWSADISATGSWAASRSGCCAAIR